MFEFCKTQIRDIIFLFVDKNQLQETREAFAQRFEGTISVPGTRSFHMFQPLSNSCIATKRCSEDALFTLHHDLLGKPDARINFDKFDFVACEYEEKWWIGMVMDVNEEEGDALVKFMHPCGLAGSFYWPSKDDQCLVPFAHILLKTDIPTTTSGRTYILGRQDREAIVRKFAK